MVEVRVFTRAARRAISRFGEQLADAPEVQRVKHQIAALALNNIRKTFIQRSSPADPTWAPLSWVTIVLRPRGRGGKIYGEADLAARRARTPKLRDTGVLLKSLTAGAPGNVFEVGRWEVRVGTNLRYAALHQRGGRSRFSFDREARRRFEQNISPTLRGRRPLRPLPGGRRHRWNQPRPAPGRHTQPSPWNRLYFVLRAVLERMDGAVRRVPRRRFVEEPSQERRAYYCRLIERGLAALARRLGL